MATPCFYYADLSESDDIVELSSTESAHALQSRRLGVGTAVRLINGAGKLADGMIHETAKRKVWVRIVHLSYVEKPKLELTVAVAMPKGDRQKVMVDMLSQLGANRVIPLRTERSITSVKCNQIEKLQRIALEACKQSHNPWLLKIKETCTLDAVLNQKMSVFYADRNGINLRKMGQIEGQVVVLIGPEGGFSADEFERIKHSGAQPIVLAEYILRTESAAIAAATLFKEPLITAM